MTATDRVASLIEAMHDGHEPPAGVLDRARLVLADQIAVSLEGTRLSDHTAPDLGIAEPTDAAATRWGDGVAGFAPDIAFENRRVADSLELTAGPECGAALTAAAEMADRSLKDLLIAVCWAAQLDAAVKAPLQNAVEQAGLHPPGFFAPVAVAGVSAWLTGLDRQACTHAVESSLCLAPASPYAAFSLGSSAKELYGAWGQRLGLTLALMTGRGLTGPVNALGGQAGLEAILGLPEAAHDPAHSGSVTDSWAIERVRFKAYPCSRACHAALTALEATEPVEMEAIERMRVTTYPFASRLSARSAPETPVGAQMHIPTALALRVVFGELPPVVAFSRARIHDPRVLDLARRIEVRSEPRPGPRQRFARIEIQLANGRRVEHECDAKWSEDGSGVHQSVGTRAREFCARSPHPKLVDTVLDVDDMPVRQLIARQEAGR